MNEKLFILESQKKKTNHILHLILSIITGGLWIVIWLLVGISNSSHNSRLQGEMNHVMNYKAQGLSDVETYRQVADDKNRASANSRMAIFVIGIALLALYLMANR